jgi:hypothetical protein
MNIFFWVISILITLYTGWRYIPEILKWKIKPHAFSWLPWTILAGIAFVIQIQNGEDIWWFGALAWSTLVCGIIFLLSLKYWEKHITTSDKLSLVGSLILIVFWITTKDDLLALMLICLIDIFSFYPTWRKSWKKPNEENISMYSLSSLKSFLSIFALQNLILVNWLYPLFLALINLSFALYLVWRRKIIKK